MSDEQQTALATRHESTELSVAQVIGRLDKIQQLTRDAMVKGIDYGVIPGTGSKPTLLKPGAEKLCVMFRFAPEYKTNKTFHDDGHLTVECTCKILDLGGNFLGEASAMCSTRESKYAYRNAARICPACGKPAIIKGKAEYGGGWVCFKKKDGCGAKFGDNEPAITTQLTGRVPNEDLADSYNTVLRIAEKRALIGAVRLVTGSSALFDEEIPAVNERDADHGNGEHEAPKSDAKKGEPQPDAAVVMLWQERMAAEPTIDAINYDMSKVRAIADAPTRKAVFKMIVDSLKPHGIEYDKTRGCFGFTGEPKQEPATVGE